MVHTAHRDPTLDELTHHVLREWAERGDPTPDPGPVVLASTLPPDDPTAALAARTWLNGLRHTANPRPGLFGGLAGHLAGLRLLAAHHPALHRLATPIAGALRRTRPRGTGFGFPDYDLVSGPAGVLLAHCAPAADPDELAPHAAHLAELCARGAEGLRCTAYEHHDKLAWMQGRINLGLAHGVPGVAVALAAAVRAGTGQPAAVAALRALGRWLADQAHHERGAITWSAADGTPPRTRRAWCYGVPGVAWALWETGTALGDPDLTALAAAAVSSPDDFHFTGDTPGDRLAVCHGAAGVLAVFDAFTRAGLPGTAAAVHRLLDHLRRHQDEVAELARTDMTLLNGAAGVLAAARTASGAPRGWLPLLGLR
ncbi:lanthionine synthetase LanC family protein [Saccharothrix syringae]|uniref:Subtilin biosynthesis protein spaC n=1 Tax=Saccharothrix syringae TaxID=103733 RepID=A0A5Q0H1Z2_SACSY|nr:lanthionine synthetase LanC family protein [Saccharothrix syringae]QFZ20218.1 subtilin biosynthesis protein spaC [Saccharothrix syringae]